MPLSFRLVVEEEHPTALHPQGLSLMLLITHRWTSCRRFCEFHSNGGFPSFYKENQVFWFVPCLRHENSRRTTRILDESPFVRALSEATWFVVVRNEITDLYVEFGVCQQMSHRGCMQVCSLVFLTPLWRFKISLPWTHAPVTSLEFTTTHKTLWSGPQLLTTLRGTSCVEAEAYDLDKERILEALQNDYLSVEK
jgi:hypothetical protein